MSKKNEGRHAFLILAYRDLTVLSKFLSQIDDERNDIYLHIDSKSKLNIIDIPKMKYSNIKIYKKYKVVWGGSNFSRVELYLLEEAQKNEYDYYHLCSEADLMLKSNDDFHQFFKIHKGKEFIHFEDEKFNEKYLVRVQHFHVLGELIRRYNSKKLSRMFTNINRWLLKVQDLIGFNRKIPFEELQKGCNWVSITDSLALYILENKKNILKFIKMTCVGEELFIHSLIYKTPYMDQLYGKGYEIGHLACARVIDWKRGQPYIFTEEDFDLLTSTEAMFARKFNSSVDMKIIDEICEFVKK